MHFSLENRSYEILLLPKSLGSQLECVLPCFRGTIWLVPDDILVIPENYQYILESNLIMVDLKLREARVPPDFEVYRKTYLNESGVLKRCFYYDIPRTRGTYAFVNFVT